MIKTYEHDLSKTTLNELKLRRVVDLKSVALLNKDSSRELMFYKDLAYFSLNNMVAHLSLGTSILMNKNDWLLVMYINTGNHKDVKLLPKPLNQKSLVYL